MPKYKVWTSEVVISSVTLDAKNQAEAEKKVTSGEYGSEDLCEEDSNGWQIDSIEEIPE